MCGITADEVRGLARDYGTTQPAAIRLNYGMQRVRGGGNAARLIALLPCLIGAWRHRAGGLLLSSSGWFTRCATTPRCSGPTCWPAARPRTINMSTIGDDLLREASPAFGPKIEALVVYNSNPVAVAPESPKVVPGFARDDLFTVVLEHFMTDTADHADYVLPATTQLEHLDVHTTLRPHLRADQRAGDRAARRGAGRTRRSSASWRARMGFDDAVLRRRATRRSRAPALRRATSTSTRCASDGWVKLPLPEAPFADGGFPTPTARCTSTRPGCGVPDYVPNYESARSRRRRWPRAIRWR